MVILKKEFYEKETTEVAKNLLGKLLCRKDGNTVQQGIIVETEAYTQNDPSCHAYKGKTPRCESLFKSGGFAYVYFTYGMYHCLNISTEKEGYGSGVLIRAIEPVKNITNTNGPAKLCREMNITKELNGIDMTTNKNGLWVEDYKNILPKNIITTTRIGIKVATDYPFRFYIKDNKWVSK